MNGLSADMKKEFEKRIAEDKEFAEEVAFYLSAKEAIAEEAMNEKKDRFRKVYEEYKKTGTPDIKKNIVRKLWPYIAAAAIIAGIIVGRNVLVQPSAQQIADRYINDNFKTLPVTMSSRQDSLQTGIRLYNEGKTNDALRQFESILHRDTSSIEAKKYAGIVCLQMKQYEKAMAYFLQLGNYQLYANPGKFYLSLTLLKRNLPGDKQQAKLLLQQVLQNDLEGKETATQLLDKL